MQAIVLATWLAAGPGLAPAMAIEAAATETSLTPSVPSDVVRTYGNACAPCHGGDGRGNGPAAFSIAPGRAPRPRDFTAGRYKLRSTPSGHVPTDADLMRTIRRGIPRYMPAFGDLDEATVLGLVQYVKGKSPRFGGASPVPIEIPRPPSPAAGDTAPAAAERGAKLYGELGCVACHGERGRGNGTAAAALKDMSGDRIWPADLAHPSWFKGGSSREDVYRTLMTGMDGTPMPGYHDVFAGLPPRAPWDLIVYVESLSRE